MSMSKSARNAVKRCPIVLLIFLVFLPLFVSYVRALSMALLFRRMVMSMFPAHILVRFSGLLGAVVSSLYTLGLIRKLAP